MHQFFIIIIMNIKDWTLWSVPSPKLQLFSPTFLRSSSCSPSLWSVVVWCMISKGLKGWYWPQGLLSMPIGNIRKSWETSSDMTSVSSASTSDFLTSSLVIPGNATLVVAERSGWRRVLGASKPRLSAKQAHPYRKRACLQALRLATTKLNQWGTGYPSWGHPTQLRISRGSTGLIHKWQFFILIHLLHSSTCFEHYCAHLQEDNCISTASDIVTLFGWLFSTQVTREAVLIQLSSWRWAQQCSKHVEECNKCIKIKNLCASIWYTNYHIRMHGQQNVKILKTIHNSF